MAFLVSPSKSSYALDILSIITVPRSSPYAPRYFPRPRREISHFSILVARDPISAKSYPKPVHLPQLVEQEFLGKTSPREHSLTTQQWLPPISQRNQTKETTTSFCPDPTSRMSMLRILSQTDKTMFPCNSASSSTKRLR